MADNKNDKHKNKKQLTDEQNDRTVAENENEKAQKNEEKPLLPRKRRIVKNVRFPIMLGILAAVFLTAIVWKVFFDNSVVGVWSYVQNGEYVETFDAPSETEDAPEPVTTRYKQNVSYEFKENGDCIVTLGTMSVPGRYTIYTSESGSMISASVTYQNTVLLYGNYKYQVKGNMFTGKKLVISGLDPNGDVTLEPGEGEDGLTPFDDPKYDGRLVGKWRDSQYELEYEFTDDGHMIRTGDDGLTVKHVYTVFDNEETDSDTLETTKTSFILVKYIGDTEQNYTYNYEFVDDTLYIDGSKLEKIE
ncbi:MAG: hypothetical protein II685_03940 [Clostridia bacterium]|nr:hypothetical protein [Clostridia bacterium]